MCSVRFNKDDKETYDYICEGYDIQEGDEVVVTGKKKQIVHVTVTDIFWATEKSLNEALPGGSSRFKKIQGKSVNVA